MFSSKPGSDCVSPRLMQKRPQDRYHDCGEVIEALRPMAQASAPRRSLSSISLGNTGRRGPGALSTPGRPMPLRPSPLGNEPRPSEDAEEEDLPVAQPAP